MTETSGGGPASRIDTFLELAIKQGGSDLHLVSGQPPRIRIHGQLHRVRFRELSLEDMERILSECVDERKMTELDEKCSVDVAYQSETLGRFRVNIYRHVRGLAAAFRAIPADIRSIEDLGLPETLGKVAEQPRGLTLVTGPTGSGKSTTLAAIVDRINTTRKNHIITIEDPIEFVHSFKKSVITQRQVGLHAPSFAEALRNALREDPDVLLVGEMRDLETIGLALTAAETGVQVLGTLHTTGAVRTVDRIVNVFPAERQAQVRTMLAESLRMVISQQLVPTRDGSGRACALEILVNTHACETLIRSGKTQQLTNVIQTNAKAGMRLLDTELMRLIQEGTITATESVRFAIDKGKFEQLASREAA